MRSSLKDKTINGVLWSAVDNFAKLGVTFGVSIILARLLTPDDYGLLGIIQIVTVVCNTLINAGFANALIRKKDVSEVDYSTTFIINFVLSIILYLTIFVCSPQIASFFAREELIPLMRVTSLSIIIGAFSLVQLTRLTKRIDFKTQTKITLIASIGSGVIGIVMALDGFGVWALVAQVVTVELLRTSLLWYYNRWMPQLVFSSQSFHDLFGFGWKIMVTNLIDAIWRELNQVVIGKFYNPATLGKYTRAGQFSHLFSNNLTSVVQRVTYPVLSSIQDDSERLVSAYRRIIKTTMFVTAISMLTLAAVSQPLLYCLIGPKWNDAASYLPLICISGSLYPLHAINLNMLQVQGRSDLYLKLEIIKKIILLIPLYIGIMIGVMPMLYAGIGVSIVAFFLNSYYSGKFLNYSSWMQIKDIAPSYGIAAIISLPLFFLKYIPFTSWVILPMQMILCVALLIIICNILKVREYYSIKEIALNYLSKMKQIKR
jgi:O-antigen/teichoic acid export membrane protein